MLNEHTLCLFTLPRDTPSSCVGMPYLHLKKYLLQNGQKLPKWEPCAQCGVLLGISKQHSSNIPQVLHLSTGAISPQYHVVFDNYFQYHQLESMSCNHGKTCLLILLSVGLMMTIWMKMLLIGWMLHWRIEWIFWRRKRAQYRARKRVQYRASPMINGKRVQYQTPV